MDTDKVFIENNLVHNSGDISEQYNIYSEIHSSPVFIPKDLISSSKLTIPVKEYLEMYSGKNISISRFNDGIIIDSIGLQDIKVIQDDDYINVSASVEDNKKIYKLSLNDCILDEKYSTIKTIKLNEKELPIVNGVVKINTSYQKIKLESPNKSIGVFNNNQLNNIDIEVKQPQINNVDLRPSILGAPINLIDSDDISVNVVDVNENKVNLKIKDVNKLNKIVFNGVDYSILNGIITIVNTNTKRSYHGSVFLTAPIIKDTLVNDFDLTSIAGSFGERPSSILPTDTKLIYKNGILINIDKYIITGDKLKFDTSITLQENDLISWLIINN